MLCLYPSLQGAGPWLAVQYWQRCEELCFHPVTETIKTINCKASLSLSLSLSLGLCLSLSVYRLYPKVLPCCQTVVSEDKLQLINLECTRNFKNATN